MKQTAVEWFAQELYEKFEMRGDGTLYNELLEQAKEMEKEQKFSMDFIVWYSGMKPHQIENAHKRWINETFKSE